MSGGNEQKYRKNAFIMWIQPANIWYNEEKTDVRHLTLCTAGEMLSEWDDRQYNEIKNQMVARWQGKVPDAICIGGFFRVREKDIARMVKITHERIRTHTAV